MATRREILSKGIIGGAVVSIAGCSDLDLEPESEFPNETHTHEPENDEIELSDASAEVRDNNEVWGTVKLSNQTGRPIQEIALKFTFLDELGDPIGSGGPFTNVKGIRHGDIRAVDRFWDASRREAEAVRSVNVRVEDISYSSTKYYIEDSGECDSIDSYMCGDGLKIESFDEEKIATGSGEEWTVFGKVKNYSDSEYSRNRTDKIVAHYINNGEIIEGWDTEVPDIDPGGSSQFRITFPYGPGVFSVRPDRPQGDLRISLTSEQ